MLTFCGYSQSNTKVFKDTVVWNPNYVLTKSDFKGKAKKGLAGMAQTFIYLHTEEKNGNIYFIVEAVLSRTGSFLSSDSDYEFNHEKGHFDICEIYARKLRQKIKNKDFLKVKNISKEIAKMYDEVIKKYNEEQEKYDKQTEHSMNMVQQKVWEEKIAKELKELDAYSSTEVDVVNK